jgi:hypothetical protein
MLQRASFRLETRSFSNATRAVASAWFCSYSIHSGMRHRVLGVRRRRLGIREPSRLSEHCGDGKRACTCSGAGMPCLVCNQPESGERPRLPAGFVPYDDADLRGTRETQLLDRGMSPAAVAARCGHDAAVMLRSYAERTKKADATPLPAAPVRRGGGPLLFTTEKSGETAQNRRGPRPRRANCPGRGPAGM